MKSNIFFRPEEAMLETGKSLSTELNELCFRENYPSSIFISRMRNSHTHLRTQYGIESVRLFSQWERIKGKMVDFKYHRRFSLRCLSEDLIPVSIRLRSNIRTPKGQYIIRRA